MTQTIHAEEALTVEEIFRRHAAFAWRVLRRLGVPESDVDDVCQDVVGSPGTELEFAL